MTMKVLLVQDHLLFGDCLDLALGIECSVSTVADIDTALNMLDGRRAVDLVLLDLSASRSHGFSLLSRLETGGLVPDVLVLARDGDDVALEKSRQSGAKGCITTSCSKEQMRDALLQVRAGEEYWPNEHGEYPAPVLPSIDEQSPEFRITPRQREVLSCLAIGMTNKGVATELGISEVTVKSHVSALMRVFLVKSRYACVSKALECGII